MKSQDYSNHTRVHPVFHYVLTLLVFITLIAAITNMVLAINDGANIFQAVILVLIMVIVVIVAALVRLYALKRKTGYSSRGKPSLLCTDRRGARSHTQYRSNCRVTICWRQ